MVLCKVCSCGIHVVRPDSTVPAFPSLLLSGIAGPLLRICLQDYASLTPDQRLAKLLEASTPAGVAADAANIIQPYLKLLPAGERSSLLHAVLAQLAPSRLEWCCALLESEVEHGFQVMVLGGWVSSTNCLQRCGPAMPPPLWHL